jgi:hypothetical protein
MPLDLLAQLGDGFFRGHDRRLDRFDRLRQIVFLGGRLEPFFQFIGIDRFGGANRADVGLDLTGRFHLRDFVANLVEGRVDGIDGLLR